MVSSEVQHQRRAGHGNHGEILRCREWPHASKMGERTDLAFLSGGLDLVPRTYRRGYVKLNANY